MEQNLAQTLCDRAIKAARDNECEIDRLDYETITRGLHKAASTGSFRMQFMELAISDRLKHKLENEGFVVTFVVDDRGYTSTVVSFEHLRGK